MTHYVPILKGKQGEFMALRHIPKPQRFALTPLVELAPVPSSAATVVGHIVKQSKELRSAWLEGGSVYVDAGQLPADAKMDNAKHPLLWIARDLAPHGINVVPVLGKLAGSPLEQAAHAVLKTNGTGLCLRLRDAETARDTGALGAALDGLLSRMKMTPSEVDIIIDQGEISEETEGRTARAAYALLLEFPRLTEWRTLTLAGTAFPAGLGDLGKGDDLELARSEMNVWGSVAARAGLPRIPDYGDYTTSAVDFPPEADGPMKVPVAIRYTTPGHYLVKKDSTWQDEGGEAAERLAQWLVAHPAYEGAQFSWGDGELDKIARGVKLSRSSGKQSSGGSSEWRGYGSSHHIARIVLEFNGD